MFARLHPNFGIGLANFSSRKSRAATAEKDDTFYGEKEMLIQYCKEQQEKHRRDYYIFGHRHFPMEIELPQEGMYVNLGDWINHFTYAVFDGQRLDLKKFES